MRSEFDEKWLSQLRKGFLELCVLVLLEQRKSSYGFELSQLLEQANLGITEGTLYPLLNRMHKNGWLDSSWETPTEKGHPRRIYKLSKTGRKQLPAMLEAYLNHHSSLLTLKEMS
ncbi:MAG: helix-turn-helix transcriptional regulator [Pseudomonadota bacterium]